MPLNGFDSTCSEYQERIVSYDKRHTRIKHIANNINLNRVNRYKIDGCVINVGKRCDFLLMNEDERTAYLIELKGSDLKKAVEQLESTESTLKDQLQSYKLNFRIVLSKVCTQDIRSVTYRRFQAEKKLVKCQTNQIEEVI